VFAVLAALLGLLVVVATDQILPASSAYQAQMRLWLAGHDDGAPSGDCPVWRSPRRVR